MHQPIDIEPVEAERPAPEASSTEAPPAEAPQTEAAPSQLDAAFAELLEWITKQEAIREQSAHRQLVTSEPQPEPARVVIRIPDDVPSFETV